MDMPTLYYEDPPLCNRLWAAMPITVRDRLHPYLERVPLPLGEDLYETGPKRRYVYFPIHGQVSLVYVMGNIEAQVASVGCEGLIGVATLMDSELASIRPIVQSAGSAYRLLGSVLKAELLQNSALQPLLLRYFHHLLLQVAQIALCNRYHNIEQQLCRCLLLSSKCNPAQSLILTQEMIARMLGVRREGVTLAAGKLQQLKVISYHRGRIRILDRARLERLACECYQVLKNKAPQ